MKIVPQSIVFRSNGGGNSETISSRCLAGAPVDEMNIT